MATRGKRLVVIGGGISGLSYVHYLRNFLVAQQKSHLIDKITLLEANKYMGGSIKTNTFEDGLIHEMGPRSVRCTGVKGKNTLTLLEQMNLQDHIVFNSPQSKSGKKRFVYINGRLQELIVSPFRPFTRIPGTQTRLLLAFMKELRQPKLDLTKFEYEDPTVHQFFSHRLGEDVADSIINPMLRGITAGCSRKLSMSAMFGDVLQKEQQYGSVIKGLSKPITMMSHDDLFPNEIMKSKLLDKLEKEKATIWNLSTGLQTIADRLNYSLLNTNDDGKVTIYNQSRVSSLKLRDARQAADNNASPCEVTVTTIDGDKLSLSADHVIAALPSSKLGEILSDESTPENQVNVFEYVTSIPHVPVGCVTVEYRGKLPSLKALNAFGFLTHSEEKCKVLGVAFDTSAFPDIDAPHDSFRMTAMIGGYWFEQMTGTSNVDKVSTSTLEQIALDEIRRILKIDMYPHRMSCELWKTGIAQYYCGHKQKVAKTRMMLEHMGLPVTLLGQSYDGVGVNDVIWSARQEAYAFVKSL